MTEKKSEGQKSKRRQTVSPMFLEPFLYFDEYTDSCRFPLLIIALLVSESLRIPDFILEGLELGFRKLEGWILKSTTGSFPIRGFPK